MFLNMLQLKRFQFNKILLTTACLFLFLTLGLYVIFQKQTTFDNPVKRSNDDDHLKRLVEISHDDMLQFNGTLKKILVPRVSDTTNHALVREFIEKYLKTLGWTVELDHFEDRTPLGLKKFTNIVGTLNPKACKRVVLACHYDSKHFDDHEFLGATDSAVPCSMILELIRRLDSKLKKNSSSNDVTLQVIFFDGEEAFVQWDKIDSLYGSRHLAAKLDSQVFSRSDGACSQYKNIQTDLERIQMFILLDLIGEASPRFCSHSSKTRPLFQQIQKIERKLNKLKVLENQRSRGTDYFPTRCDYTFGIDDDHVPFEELGVPILHIIATPFPKTWHTRHDHGDNLHHPTINNLMKIFQLFFIEYLQL